MWLAHGQLDIIHFDLSIFFCDAIKRRKVSFYGSDGGIVAVSTGGGAYPFFQRVLRGDNEVNAVKSGHFYQMPDYGQMAYVQRIE